MIGISSLATDHLIVPKLMAALREAGLADVAVIVGGIVPDDDEDDAARCRRGARVPSRRAARGDRRDHSRAHRARFAPGASPPEGVPDEQADRQGRAAAARARTRWQREYAGADRRRSGRCAIAPASRSSRCTRRATGTASATRAIVGYPGAPPYTRGIYATMHRGRTWTQRQLIGLGTPSDYNARLRDIVAQGATAVSLIPCNSVFRGYDMDEVDAELLGTCGVVVNTRRSPGHLPRRRRPRADFLRDERPVAVHAARVPARDGEAPRRRLRRDPRHVEPERLPQSLRREPHVLPHRAARRAAHPHRPSSISASGTCRSGIRCRSSASTCSRPGRRPRRRWDSRSPPRCRPPTTASPAAWIPTPSCRG